MTQDRFDRLYRRFGPSVFARCRRILCDDAAAEDATQEVFVRALRSLPLWMRDDREALLWLYRVSTNVCLSTLRRKATREGAAPQLRLEETGADPATGFEERQACLVALREVPDSLSAPALLYFVDEMDQGSIARALGVTRRTVINRLAAFARRAAELLGADEP